MKYVLLFTFQDGPLKDQTFALAKVDGDAVTKDAIFETYEDAVKFGNEFNEADISLEILECASPN